MKETGKLIGKFILVMALNTLGYYIADTIDQDNNVLVSKKEKDYQNECIDTSTFLD